MLKIEELEPREVPAAASITPAFCSWYGWSEGHEGDASYAGNWDGRIPQDGDTIYIPHNSSPLLDLTGLPLTSIGFQSSSGWGGTVVSSAIELVSPLLRDLTWQFSGGNLALSGQDGDLADVEFSSDSPDELVYVEAGQTIRLPSGLTLHCDFRIDGTGYISGWNNLVHVNENLPPNFVPEVIVSDGGQLQIRPWFVSGGDILPTWAIWEGVGLRIEQGGTLALQRSGAAWTEVAMQTDTYVVNNGTVRIEDSARLTILGATDTNDSAFPFAGLYSTGTVELQAGNAPTLTTSGKLDVVNGWYQRGGYVVLSHNVPNTLGPQNHPDVYMWGPGYFVDTVWFTSSAESVGTGGFICAGDLTFVSNPGSGCAFVVRDSFVQGEGIDAIQANNISFTGIAPRVIVDAIGQPDSSPRHFIVVVDQLSGWAPVFQYDPAHWSAPVPYQNGPWGDIAYIP